MVPPTRDAPAHNIRLDGCVSTSDETVERDYGLDPTPVAKAGAPERRIWETTTVVPDPHRAGYFYVTQKLAGEWKRRSEREMKNRYIRRSELKPGQNITLGRVVVDDDDYKTREEEVVWYKRLDSKPPVTRVLYCTFDEKGVMQNVNKDASQGRSVSAGTAYVSTVPSNAAELADVIVERIRRSGELS